MYFPKPQELSGKKYGRLNVLRLSDIKIKGRGRIWLCRCDCGKETTSYATQLNAGKKKSCGCLQRDAIRQVGKKYRVTHGLSFLPEYGVYGNMLVRCQKGNKYSKNHGDRGISVCDEWVRKSGGFERFLRDLGPRPTPFYSLERINNDGNYCPENCCWATVKTQLKNRRKRAMIHQFTNEEILAEAKKRGLI